MTAPVDEGFTVVSRKKNSKQKAAETHLGRAPKNASKLLDSKALMNKKPVAKSAARKYCAFFPLPQGCTKGSKCPFRHEIPDLDDTIDRDRVCKFQNICVIEEDDGTCLNGAFCPFLHKKRMAKSAVAQQNGVRSGPPPTPSTACSLSPSTLQSKPGRRGEEQPSPSSTEATESPEVALESQATAEQREGALVRIRATFTASYTAPAEGYLTASTGQVVEILYDEGEWYFGRTATVPEGGWFPKVIARVQS